MAPSARVSVAVVALSLSLASAIPYQLANNWQGGTFFDGFDFITADDPSGGWVTYVDQGTAQAKGMATPNQGAPTYIGVDHTSYYNAAGGSRDRRAAIRLQSKQVFNKGLFIADVAHMPGGICGVWPALWMVGNNWPHGGEWDFAEGVNLNTQNQMTAHTDAGCTTNGAGAVGTVVEGNCNANSAFNGCGTVAQNTASFGIPFNNNGGGVWATQWTDSHISTWFFSRNNIPSNIANPDPSTWGPPGAMINVNTGCNIDQFFPNGMNLIVNTDFCGGWVAGDWGNSGCQARTGTNNCPSYVANNPGAFTNAYWSINYIRTFNPAPGFRPAALKSNIAEPNAGQNNHTLGSMVEDVFGGVFGPGYKGGPQ